MDHRSGLVNIFSAIRSLPQGHDKPVKQALYNTVALFLLIVCCAAGCALYIIFQSFVKPLMWALLVGSTLHPLKRSLRDRFQTWFQNLEINNTPIVFGVILVPVNIVNDISDFIGKHLWKRLKLIIVIGIIVPIILLIYHYTPKIIVKILWRFVLLTFRTINCFIDASSIWIVGLILIAYISMVFLLWRCDNNKKFHYSSIVIWIFGSSCLAKQFGYYQLPVFILLQIVIFGGFISEVYEHYKTMKESGQPITLPESLSQVFHESHVIEEEIIDSGKEDVEEDDIVTLPEEKKEEMKSIKDKSKDPLSLDLFESTNPIINQKPKLLKRSLSQPYFSSKIIGDSALRFGKKISYSHTSLIDTESCSSTFYLITVMWACIVMFFWKNLMFLLLLPFPILYYIIKHLGYYIGLWSYLYEKVCDIFEKIASWCHERHDALVPVPIRGLYNIIHKLNSFLKNAVKNGIDTVASCVVIFGLIIFLICTSVFIAFQIYAEAIMLVEMTGSLINQTIVHNPEIKQLLPPSYYNVDAFLDNTYKYGREGISHIVKGSMSNVDSTESKQLEKQILELWDRVYQNWMSSNDTHGPKVTDEAVILTWNDFIENLQKSPEMFNINGLIEFGQQNIGTLMSLLESVLGILKGNISLIFGSFTTLITVILEGGTAVINFSISLVVFFTALFYLLHSSGDHYKPVELLTNFSPSGMRLGHALEGAIIGVFSATFKMTAFYGMWTWFIHNLFGIKIVYLPTVFAAILGAVPFLGTYWAGVPAILNLWLAQDRGIEAIIFAVFQVLPTSVVDTTIYKEIKGGGHPYLTGLAIAGGIISLGIEGAIIGPMLLCGLYVAIDLSSTLFKETPSEEVINLRLRQLQNT
ncbi:transmembrane protein 245 [Diorhabda carinulata]|uniref:transmembrane protein 245 n=1 Tax=Diorhabda carinulata TaxID=1163345 RepID=UPI0025A3007A|nr:transmembrane protein 245 [Diorhabda carinulata]